MVSFASSFGVGGGSQSFSAKVRGHGERVGATVAIQVAAVFPNSSAWGNMATLRTWKYSVREVPGASNVSAGVVIQILGGPGFGTLNVDQYKIWTAMLTEMELESVNVPAGGLVSGRLTFIMQPS